MAGESMAEAIRRYQERREARMAERKQEAEWAITRYRARRSARLALRRLEEIQSENGKSLDTSPACGKIQSPQNLDGGPGSGNFGHEGVPGQVGGSAPSGAEGVTKFPTVGGKMQITSDLKVKASKSGKTMVTIPKGGEIEGIYSFAGKGSDKNLVVAGLLSKQFGGKPGEWGHLCGFATVVAADGSEHRIEIHWFEHDDIGQIKFKVKIRQGGTE